MIHRAEASELLDGSRCGGDGEGCDNVGEGNFGGTQVDHRFGSNLDWFEPGLVMSNPKNQKIFGTINGSRVRYRVPNITFWGKRHLSPSIVDPPCSFLFDAPGSITSSLSESSVTP